MNPVTQHLISSYLLMPLLTVIFGIAAYFIARKNKLLNNKKLIAYLLLCGIILALPGLSGFMDYNFMPYAYILLVILYWTAGYYNRLILRKVWKYSEEYDSDTLYINRERSIVMDVDIFRRVDDPASERITGKASEDVIFGQWFQRMIDDCNLKSPSSPIVYKNEGGAYYEWVFYTKPSFFKRRRYIDPDVTLAGNKLKRHDVIIAKRVANELIKYNEY